MCMNEKERMKFNDYDEDFEFIFLVHILIIQWPALTNLCLLKFSVYSMEQFRSLKWDICLF